jgi:cob(I)alamin adenosyltransferase
MKVYTRKGDDGSTGLLYGGRVPKDAPGPTAYGTTDEAVAALGLARAETEPGGELAELLVRLQRELFVVGAELATRPDNRRAHPGHDPCDRGDGPRSSR